MEAFESGAHADEQRKKLLKVAIERAANEVVEGWLKSSFYAQFNYHIDESPIPGTTVMREEGRGEEVDAFEKMAWEYRTFARNFAQAMYDKLTQV